MDDEQRIVVTGMGVVSALGHNLADTWEGLSAGRSGVEARSEERRGGKEC